MIRENRNVSFQDGQQLPGPVSVEQREDWLTALKSWREKRWEELGGRPQASVYDAAALKWTQTAYVETKVLVYDLFFYDVSRQSYTIDRLLDDFKGRYGGIDSVVLWSVYPNIGIDTRNQLDFTRELPGGTDAVRRAIERFHACGVHVLLQFMPWDTSTGLDEETLPAKVVALASEIGADGLFADTLGPTPKAYWAAAERAGLALALEPENGMNHGDLRHPDGGVAFGQEGALAWNPISWGYWRSSYAPTVSKYKWLEPRHTVHLCQRWARDRREMLQDAFFNGLGVQAWENIWGIWNGITARDAGIIRRMRQTYLAAHGAVTSSSWEPHYPTLNEGIFSSRFPGQKGCLYTLINRDEVYADGPQLSIPHVPQAVYTDLWRGGRLQPDIRYGRAVLSFRIEGDGFGAVFVSEDGLAAEISTAYPPTADEGCDPSSADSTWRPLLQKLVTTENQKKEQAVDGPRLLEGSIRILEDEFLFRVSGMMIEGGNARGVGVQYPWEAEPRRAHHHLLTIPEFLIDQTLVTNRDFLRFLTESSYRPKDDTNYLKHWSQDGFAAGTGDQPVVWVALEDAQAYAHWYGKRLPHEWEWQYAAQGQDGRLYPWGDDDAPECRPSICHDPSRLQPGDVKAHPQGASPFGVLDLVGNVWQWTDTYSDDHNRFAILRGGSRYCPQGSGWYFPNSLRLDRHGKYLLMAPSLDRSGMIGFRCVRDV